MMRRKLKTLLALALSVTLLSATALPAAAAGSGTSKIGISQTRASIGVGETVRLKVTGTKKKVKWSSTNKKVATVSGGKVTGRKAGKTTVTAKVKGKTLKCRVTVTRKPYLSRKSASVFIGRAVALKVYGTSKKATWTSSDEAVATVDNSGKVAGKKAGTAVITAKVGGTFLRCKVKVKHVLEVSKTKLNVRGTGTVKVKLHAYATINCFTANSAVAKCTWGKWGTWKNGTNEVTLTVTGKQKGTTKIILTNSYNKEAPEIDVTVTEVKS